MSVHTVTAPRGPLECGWCGEADDFAGDPGHAYLRAGWLRLTGLHTPGVAAGVLVVLAQVAWSSGRPAGHVVHFCKQVPADLYERYADQIAAAEGGQ